jgi:hypothetical protein
MVASLPLPLSGVLRAEAAGLRLRGSSDAACV